MVCWKRTSVSVELWGKWKQVEVKDETEKKAGTSEIVEECECRAVKINFSWQSSVKPSDHLLHFYLSVNDIYRFAIVNRQY